MIEMIGEEEVVLEDMMIMKEMVVSQEVAIEEIEMTGNLKHLIVSKFFKAISVMRNLKESNHVFFLYLQQKVGSVQS